MKITDLTSESVAGPDKCWPGHRKVGTKPGTGKNAGKRVNDCEKIKEQDAGLNEFAPDDGSGGEEETLHKYARMWYNGDLATQQQVEQVLARMGWEIGELESEEGGAFVIQAGDEHGDSYIGFTAVDLTEASLATMRDYFAGDDEARDPYEITKQRVHFSKDKNSKAPVQKKFNSKAEYEDWLEQQKNKKAFKVTEGVIIGPSETGDPMDPQVAVLGGAGSYSLKGLYNKAQRESAQLTKDIGLGNFRSSAYNVKQLENTLNTIVAAHNELEAVRKGGGAKSRGIERGVDTKE